MHQPLQQSGFSRWRKKLRDFVIFQVLHAHDPPHRLALGVGLGVFVAFTPTVGIQMLLVVCGAWLLKANKAVGLPVVWISNPATMLPIYYAFYWVGRQMLGGKELGAPWWEQLRNPPPGAWEAIMFYWSHFLQIAGPLWLGSLLIAAAVAIPSYYLTYFSVCRYRMKKWGSLQRPQRKPVNQVRRVRPMATARHDAA